MTVKPSPSFIRDCTYNEDDTFRKLSQKPFDVVANAIAENNLRDYKGVDSDFIIKCYGWTVEEYAREWNRRNPD